MHGLTAQSVRQYLADDGVSDQSLSQTLSELRKGLDLLKGSVAQQLVESVAQAVMESGAVCDPCMLAVCNALSINTGATVGMYPVRSEPTRAHQHVMGVLHILGRGRKRWRFWRVGRDPSVDPHDSELIQEWGDMLYFPPGWWHEVHTEMGEPIVLNGKQLMVCMHWVAWAWPLARRMEAVGQWFGGHVVEGQALADGQGRGQSVRQVRQKVWATLLLPADDMC